MIVSLLNKYSSIQEHFIRVKFVGRGGNDGKTVKMYNFHAINIGMVYDYYTI